MSITIQSEHFTNTWLPISGYQPAPGPFFERYGEDFSPATPRLAIYLPVEKKP